MAEKTGWTGVYPAVTTILNDDESVDLDGTARHVDFLIDSGVHGVIMLGSVGENMSLDAGEKRAVLKRTVASVQGRVPVLSGVAESSTAVACRFAADAEAIGVDGLMVLPPMVYKTDEGETIHHYRKVASNTGLPIMCYNNPVSYGVDITPEMFAALADVANLTTIKESSENTRRLIDITNVCGDRYTLFCGVDDLIVESVALGVKGWVAGFVNALPHEAVRLWDLATQGRWDEARALYAWFAPLMHLAEAGKLVQHIKLAQSIVGVGPETTRAPRLRLEGDERARVTAIIRAALDARPRLAAE
ncbi:MAG TPA: dihydrodipicolinate synthase family protein [Rhodospirillales bacterium]|jgi:4-hydroxy-tetrahydrodipicolinate synthase|nr:dihydrodipicolinate synthase family protein [Rhodospirillales bacterium]